MTLEQITALLAVGEAEESSEPDARVPALVALSEGMGSPPPDKEAPVREVLARLGDNWSALILKVLSAGEFRHATLKRVITALATEQGISQRMLTLRLRALEHDGFVSRREDRTVVPPRVFYTLTPMGHELNTQHSALLDWIEAHSADIEAARARFSETEQ